MPLASYSREQAAKITFQQAQPETLNCLFYRQPVEFVQPGQSIFFEGDEAKHVFEVVAGALRIFRILSDGRRVVTGFVFDGDLLGVSLRKNYLYSAEALVDTKIRRLTRKNFDLVVRQSEDLAPRAFEFICDEMAAVQDQMVLLACKSAEERLCTFLLKHLRKSMTKGEGQSVVKLPMTRQDMADYLGLTIETVSRMITKLSTKGVLGCVGRHSVKVMKPMLLAQLAGDDDVYEWATSIEQSEGRRHN
ncbi:Crp/Fnr family transcriptional regulator [Rhizobium wenxiniae]|uniref:CRP/FNR family transcriptional regulator n=1 Tax=Rhizobium wenxiniae TaxID=1737357 RepID=A0A7W9YCU2_9HYPH|nr:helix-turn-helix domain-containing protein [Rhizobium wenxiniae]MBB6166261.1 CRP/FNR family transcriptional regulator [Rhizobium wenxiniae]GGG22091.1 Crp/Fnr family transcriptional regulator [Rhizobium wenxiniae]